MKQKIALLGSTGSIGRQTLDVVRTYSDDFEITALSSNRNWELLARQAVEFGADSVVIADKRYYPPLSEALAGEPVKVYAGADALCQVVGGSGVDVVINALVGYAGLAPTVSTLEAGKKLALANKESLVVAGDIVMKMARERQLPVIPIDSEHSAIFQCLAGETSPPYKLILTASGGPFRNMPAEEMAGVTVEQALAHPNWAMGPKISIDSATMLNKGFEVIEAHWLFGIAPAQIEVVVHPQSIVHSLVEFADGALKAQLGTPDMHLPIQYALTFPHRWTIPGERFDMTACGTLTFMPPDMERFPSLGLAYRALEAGGNSGCILNAANEVAVAAFLERKIGFTDIPRVIEHTMGKASLVSRPTLDDYRQSNDEARGIAARMTGR